MKKLLVLIAILALAACSREKDCIIKGTIDAEDKRDSVWIFLVPVGQHTDADVDSTLIRDGRFQFRPDSEMVAVLRVHRKWRMGLQDLLVVTEPGTVKAVVGADSHAGGTPQNDSLQVWKDLTFELNAARMATQDIEQRKALNKAYRDRSARMAANLGDCVLGRWLSTFFPQHKENQ